MHGVGFWMTLGSILRCSLFMAFDVLLNSCILGLNLEFSIQ